MTRQVQLRSCSCRPNSCFSVVVQCPAAGEQPEPNQSPPPEAHVGEDTGIPTSNRSLGGGGAGRLLYCYVKCQKQEMKLTSDPTMQQRLTAVLILLWCLQRHHENVELQLWQQLQPPE